MAVPVPHEHEVQRQVLGYRSLQKKGKLKPFKPLEFVHLQTPDLFPILKAFVSHHSDLDQEELLRQAEHIRRAYAFMVEKHEGQLRDSGQPYAVHPATAAKWVAERGYDVRKITAALLHDLVEDCGVTLNDVHRFEYKPRESAVRDMVDFASKPIPRSNAPVIENQNDPNGNPLVRLFKIKRDGGKGTDRLVVVYPSSDFYHSVEESKTDKRQKEEHRGFLMDLQAERMVPSGSVIDVRARSNHLGALAVKMADVLSNLQQYSFKLDRKRREFIESGIKMAEGHAAKAGIDFNVKARQRKNLELENYWDHVKRPIELQRMVLKHKRVLDMFAPFGRALYTSIPTETREAYETICTENGNGKPADLPHNLVPESDYRSPYALGVPRDQISAPYVSTLSRAWSWLPHTHLVRGRGRTRYSQTQIERLFTHESVLDLNHRPKDVPAAHRRLEKELWRYLAPQGEGLPGHVAFEDWNPDVSPAIETRESLMAPGDRDQFYPFRIHFEHLSHIPINERHRWLDLATNHALLHQSAEPIENLYREVANKLSNNVKGLRWLEAPWNGRNAYSLFLPHSIFRHNRETLHRVIAGTQGIQTVNFESEHHPRPTMTVFNVTLDPQVSQRGQLDDLFKRTQKRLKGPMGNRVKNRLAEMKKLLENARFRHPLYNQGSLDDALQAVIQHQQKIDEDLKEEQEKKKRRRKPEKQ